MIREIRDFFYDNGEALVGLLLAVFYICLVFSAFFPELLYVDLFIIAAALSVGVAYAIYGIVYGLVLATASLLEWIFQPQTGFHEEELREEEHHEEDHHEEEHHEEHQREQPRPNVAREKPKILIPGFENSKVFEGITTTLIDFEAFTQVMIASDLYPYDPIEMQTLNITVSPFTTKPLKQTAPFPYHFVRHTTFLQNANAENLMSLLTCPVKNEIMTDPVVAHLIHTNSLGSKRPFVLVCDRSALEKLPGDIQLAVEDSKPHRIDYEPLQQALKDGNLIAALKRLTTNPVPETDLAQGWKYALSGGRPAPASHNTHSGRTDAPFARSDSSSDEDDYDAEDSRSSHRRARP